MTAIDLDAIQQRVNAAAEGPWELLTESCDCGGEYGCSHGEYPYAIRLPGHKVGYTHKYCNPDQADDSHRHHASDISDLPMETVEFVVAARSDVPALLAEIDRLRARADSYRDMHGRAAQELSAERAKTMRLAMTKVWTNEDGRRFMFLSDIQAALGLPVEDTLSEPEANR